MHFSSQTFWGIFFGLVGIISVLVHELWEFVKLFGIASLACLNFILYGEEV